MSMEANRYTTEKYLSQVFRTVDERYNVDSLTVADTSLTATVSLYTLGRVQLDESTLNIERLFDALTTTTRGLMIDLARHHEDHARKLREVARR